MKWSETRKGMGVTVDGNSVTTSKQGCVLSDKSCSRWSVKINSDNYGYSIIGVAQVGCDYNNFIGADAKGIGYAMNGAIYTNSAAIAMTYSYEVGDTIEFVIASDKRRLDISKNGHLVHKVPLPKGAVWYPAVGAEVGGGTKQTATWLGNMSAWDKVKDFFKNLI